MVGGGQMKAALMKGLTDDWGLNRSTSSTTQGTTFRLSCCSLIAFCFFSRPGQSQALLYKHLCH